MQHIYIYIYVYILFLIGTLSYNVLSYNNNPIKFNKKNFENFKFTKPIDMVNYLTSLEDFTMISVGEENKSLCNSFIERKLNIYYFDLNNLEEKHEILSYLRCKYKNFNSGEDLWLFHKGFFIDSDYTKKYYC